MQIKPKTEEALQQTNEFKSFVHGYIVCALWSSFYEDGEPFDVDNDESDLSDTCRASMHSDCADFMFDNWDDLQTYAAYHKGVEQRGEGNAWDYAGHDFWLTRNRHGAGFWDRGLGALGNRLTDAARAYSYVDLYIGDDEKIY